MIDSKNFFQRLVQDWSLSASVAGFISVLVGISSSAVLVFQAAQAFGLSTLQASSWLGSLCLAMGTLSIALSLWYRNPIMIAWSTPASALLVAVTGVPLSDALGAFVFSGVLIFLCGVTGFFERIMNRIPAALTAALLAGVLVRFCLEAANAMRSQPVLIGIMALAYVTGRRFLPRFTMLLVLLSAVLGAYGLGLMHFDQVHLTTAEFHWGMPTFSPGVLMSLGIPIFVVTMASQNLAGLSVMRAHGYPTPVSTLMAWSGLANTLIAPLGGFAINLAAITAAIGMGSDVHEDRKKRYISAVFSGLLYMVIGVFAASVTSLFGAFPVEMIAGITGLALLPTVSNGLQTALGCEKQREAAFLTFVIAASGLKLWGVGSAFWAIVAGTLAQMILRKPSAASQQC